MKLKITDEKIRDPGIHIAKRLAVALNELKDHDGDIIIKFKQVKGFEQSVKIWADDVVEVVDGCFIKRSIIGNGSVGSYTIIDCYSFDYVEVLTLG